MLVQKNVIKTTMSLLFCHMMQKSKKGILVFYVHNYEENKNRLWDVHFLKTCYRGHPTPLSPVISINKILIVLFYLIVSMNFHEYPLVMETITKTNLFLKIISTDIYVSWNVHSVLTGFSSSWIVTHTSVWLVKISYRTCFKICVIKIRKSKQIDITLLYSVNVVFRQN